MMALSRRNVVTGGSMLALVSLSGCGAESLASLTGSTTSQSPLKAATARTLTSLGTAGGFAATKAASVTLPAAMAGQEGGSIFSTSLIDTAYRAKLTGVANALAEAVVPVAKPVVEGGIASAETAKGPGPHPAADALEKATSALIYPLATAAIEARLTGSEAMLVEEALGQVTGIDRAGFVADIARRAIAGMFAAIGVEEATILGNELPA